MATTTNYGFVTPDDTDLVKDGAAAIRTLGTAVDTTTKALNPETTLGDLAYGSSSANVKTRLGIGAADTVLTSDGTEPSWVAASSGMVSLASGSLPTGAGTVTITSISGSFETLILLVENFSTASNSDYRLRINGDTGAKYSRTQMNIGADTVTGEANETFWTLATSMPSSAAPLTKLVLTIPFYTNTNSRKNATWSTVSGGATTSSTGGFSVGNYASTTAITELTILTASGNFGGGTYELYGAN